MAEHSGVLVYGEAAEGQLASITAELLGIARSLASKLDEKVSAVLVGSGVASAVGEAAAFGADRVYVADDAVLKDYETGAFTTVLASLVTEANPRYVLIGQTSAGRDLAPRLAFRLGAVLTTDCIALDVDTQTRGLLQTKPVYGGNARAVFTSSSFPQLATVRQKAMTALQPDPSRQAEVVNVPVKLDPAITRYRVIDRIKQKAEGIRLEDAKVVVCGGRGIGGPEGFKQLEQLAALLNGAVGATRPACDGGWVPANAQIGLTGRIVTPDVYIAVAVSGSSQHLAGCSGSKTMIAVNKDADANIFKEARFGVVGDWKQVLPAFIEKARELLAA